jgi:hypothetical protein
VSQEEKGKGKKREAKKKKNRPGCSVAAGAWHVSPLNPSANHRLACLRFRGFHLLLIILFWISFFLTLLLPSYHLYCHCFSPNLGLSFWPLLRFCGLAALNHAFV